MSHKSSFVVCLLFLLLLSIWSTAITCEAICRYNATCMTLKDCTQLYRKKFEGKHISNLLKALSCGFDMAEPKVCCPSGFAEPQQNFNPVSLLPNTNVCRIHTTNRNAGGGQADIGEHPWMVLIRYDIPEGHGYYCGGVLISSRYVVTAANCVKGAELSKSWKVAAVRLGEWNIKSDQDCYLNECSPPVVDVDIEEIITSENFNPFDVHQYNHIALLRLRSEITFTDLVKPICLPLSADKDFRKYGFENSTRVHTELANSDVTLKKGDSEGPLKSQQNVYNTWMILGVTFCGPSPCGALGWPDIYTRLTPYVDWILSKIRP